MSSFDWELDKLTKKKKKINALMKLKGNSTNILQMDLETKVGGRKRGGKKQAKKKMTAYM